MHVYRREPDGWGLVLRHAKAVSAEDTATEETMLVG
jgi:hypothetical protein